MVKDGSICIPEEPRTRDGWGMQMEQAPEGWHQLWENWYKKCHTGDFEGRPSIKSFKKFDNGMAAHIAGKISVE